MNRIAIVIAMVLAGCASTQFQPYEARTNVHEGTGGTKVVVEGVDFWANGDPPRKFKIVGIIDDERPGAIIPMAQMQSDIARKAKEAGGQGVIQIRSESQLAGYYNTGTATAQSFGNTTTAYGSGASIPMRRNISKYVVIQYLD